MTVLRFGSVWHCFVPCCAVLFRIVQLTLVRGQDSRSGWQCPSHLGCTGCRFGESSGSQHQTEQAPVHRSTQTDGVIFGLLHQNNTQFAEEAVVTGVCVCGGGVSKALYRCNVVEGFDVCKCDGIVAVVTLCVDVASCSGIR